MEKKYNSHCTKMRHSIEPRDRRYVKGYGFLSFAKNTGKNISNKYSQKLVDRAIKSGATEVETNAIKSASKRAIYIYTHIYIYIYIYIKTFMVKVLKLYTYTYTYWLRELLLLITLPLQMLTQIILIKE